MARKSSCAKAAKERWLPLRIPKLTVWVHGNAPTHSRSCHYQAAQSNANLMSSEHHLGRLSHLLPDESRGPLAVPSSMKVRFDDGSLFIPCPECNERSVKGSG